MQEHIRRAHPEHYMPKLPATEESFCLMINTPPSERRSNTDHSNSSSGHGTNDPHPRVFLLLLDRSIANVFAPDRQPTYYREDSSNPATPKRGHERNGGSINPMLGTASAAAALAELHSVKSDRDSDIEGVSYQPTVPYCSRGRLSWKR